MSDVGIDMTIFKPYSSAATSKSAHEGQSLA